MRNVPQGITTTERLHPTVTNIYTSVRKVNPFGFRHPPYTAEMAQRGLWGPEARDPENGSIRYTPFPRVEPMDGNEPPEGQACTVADSPDGSARQWMRKRPPTCPLLCGWANEDPCSREQNQTVPV